LGVGLVKLLLLCARCGWHAHAKLLRCATSGEPHDPHKARVSTLIAVSFHTEKAEKDKDTTPPTHPPRPCPHHACLPAGALPAPSPAGQRLACRWERGWGGAGWGLGRAAGRQAGEGGR
jgi:hypothetical protein